MRKQEKDHSMSDDNSAVKKTKGGQGTGDSGEGAVFNKAIGVCKTCVFKEKEKK